jgi:hypothetical protein
MPLILGTNSIKDTGYDVANSLRFNSGSSDYLSRTPGSAGNRTTWTFSAWVKLVNSSGFNPIFMGGDFSNSSPTGQNGTGLLFLNGQFYSYWDNAAGGTVTSARYRDPSAWYHIVLQANTSTLKLYVNSVEQTSKSISGNGAINYTSIHTIGTYPNIVDYLNGYMAEVCFIDGQALDPTSFGEFDEDSGIWKPIDVSGLTFGTNGFYLDFENSGSLGADVSGNGNNFTVNNLTSIDQTTDTCTNNFATLNPLVPNAGTLANGNLDYTGPTGDGTSYSTIGVISGKWYWEIKLNNTPNKCGVGIIGDADPFQYNTNGGLFSPRSYSYYPFNGNVYTNNTTNGDWSDTTTSDNGDIIGIAMDLDNGYVYFSKNGSFMNSGVPTSGATGTGGVSLTTGNDFFPIIGDNTGAGSEKALMNFGNPPFTISSGNSDGNGYGNFEYSVPSGYYALNTKNLAEYG